MSEGIGFEIMLDSTYEETVHKVVAALKEQGFGILTRIDVKATLKEKLDADFRPYIILGACNPPLAHQALLADPSIGLMLPCNVTIESIPQGGSMVRIVDPAMMMQVTTFQDNPALKQVANQARQKLELVASSLATN